MFGFRFILSLATNVWNGTKKTKWFGWMNAKENAKRVERLSVLPMKYTVYNKKRGSGSLKGLFSEVYRMLRGLP